MNTELADRRYQLLDNRAIRRELEPFGVRVSDGQAAAIRRYISILLLWNQKLNLTAITEPLQILSRHFGESLFAVRAVPLQGGRLADVGSGAGFPGLALKLALPGLEVALFEADGKKAAFLAEVKRQLGLAGVEIFRCRLEEADLSPHSFDFLSARALGHLRKLLRAARNHIRPGGSVLLWLGQMDALEIAQVKGWLWRDPILLPGSRARMLMIGQLTDP